MQGIHVELTPALQNAIQEKFEPLFHHGERIIRLNVRVHKDQATEGGHHFAVTAQAEISGPDVIAHGGDKDAYVAIDKAAAKIEQLLSRKHERRKEDRRYPHGVELDADLPKVS